MLKISNKQKKTFFFINLQYQINKPKIPLNKTYLNLTKPSTESASPSLGDIFEKRNEKFTFNYRIYMQNVLIKEFFYSFHILLRLLDFFFLIRLNDIL